MGFGKSEESREIAINRFLFDWIDEILPNLGRLRPSPSVIFLVPGTAHFRDYCNRAATRAKSSLRG